MDAHIRGENDLPYGISDILHLIEAQAGEQVRLVQQGVECVQMVIFQDRLVVTGLRSCFFGFLEVGIA
jgi:hypothetical protein